MDLEIENMNRDLDALPRLAYSVRETAWLLGVSEKSVRRLISRGLLHPSRSLRHLRISKDEIERFFEGDEMIFGELHTCHGKAPTLRARVRSGLPC